MPQLQDPFAEPQQSSGPIAGRSSAQARPSSTGRPSPAGHSSGVAGRSSGSAASPARRKPTPARYATHPGARDPFSDLDPFANAEYEIANVPSQPAALEIQEDYIYEDLSSSHVSARKARKASKRATKVAKQANMKVSLDGKNPKKRASKAGQADPDHSRGSLFQRIRGYFRGNTPRMVYLDFLGWIAAHPYILILICVIFIAIGMLFGRYYSFGCAFALAILGALMSREDFDTASYICYGTAFADFLIPYLM